MTDAIRSTLAGMRVNGQSVQEYVDGLLAQARRQALAEAALDLEHCGWLAEAAARVRALAEQPPPEWSLASPPETKAAHNVERALRELEMADDWETRPSHRRFHVRRAIAALRGGGQ